MRRVVRLETVFTDEIPETLEDGFLYVSQECRVALHNCACGCGEEVSTPLVPTEYHLTMHEEGASIWPSIGNHDFACTSHYIIDRGEIVWAGRMSRADIEAGRHRDRLLKRPPNSAPPSAFRRWLFGRVMFTWMRAMFRKILGR